MLVCGKELYACTPVSPESATLSISPKNAVLEVFMPVRVVFLLSKLYIITHNV